MGADPGWFQVWPADQVVELNRGYEVCENLPGFFGIGSSGGGELLASDARSAHLGRSRCYRSFRWKRPRPSRWPPTSSHLCGSWEFGVRHRALSNPSVQCPLTLTLSRRERDVGHLAATTIEFLPHRPQARRGGRDEENSLAAGQLVPPFMELIRRVGCQGLVEVGVAEIDAFDFRPREFPLGIGDREAALRRAVDQVGRARGRGPACRRSGDTAP